MSVLLLVRHGQASFLGDDYDWLTPLGQEQSRRLGQYWADLGLAFDQVYLGPRRRHRQTLDAVAATYRERNLPWPAPVELNGLDEHQGDQVTVQSLAQLAQEDAEVRHLLEILQDGTVAARRGYLRAMQKAMQRWVRGELGLPHLETWQTFRARVAKAVEEITRSAASGQTVAVFTSGGPVAAAVGLALGVSDEKTLELSWLVRNAAYTEFLFSGRRFSLSAFNAVSHLTSPDLLTYV